MSLVDSALLFSLTDQGHLSLMAYEEIFHTWQTMSHKCYMLTGKGDQGRFLCS